LLHFWIFPLDRAHTFLANRHSHSRCEVDSGCWQQSSQCGSTFTLRRCRFSLVGRIFEQACQIKILTFGGIFRDHTLFHIEPSIRAAECSPSSCCIRWRATWYEDFTENLFALFSFHIKASTVCCKLRGIAKISRRVLGANN